MEYSFNLINIEWNKQTRRRTACQRYGATGRAGELPGDASSPAVSNGNHVARPKCRLAFSGFLNFQIGKGITYCVKLWKKNPNCSEMNQCRLRTVFFFVDVILTAEIPLQSRLYPIHFSWKIDMTSYTAHRWMSSYRFGFAHVRVIYERSSHLHSHDTSFLLSVSIRSIYSVSLSYLQRKVPDKFVLWKKSNIEEKRYGYPKDTLCIVHVQIDNMLQHSPFYQRLLLKWNADCVLLIMRILRKEILLKRLEDILCTERGKAYKLMPSCWTNLIWPIVVCY